MNINIDWKRLCNNLKTVSDQQVEKKKKTNERLGDKVEWEKPKACSKYT